MHPFFLPKSGHCPAWVSLAADLNPGGAGCQHQTARGPCHVKRAYENCSDRAMKIKKATH